MDDQTVEIRTLRVLFGAVAELNPEKKAGVERVLTQMTRLFGRNKSLPLAEVYNGLCQSTKRALTLQNLLIEHVPALNQHRQALRDRQWSLERR